MLEKDYLILKDQIPEHSSLHFIDFINRLIQKNWKFRLGKLSINELLKHPWLNQYKDEKMVCVLEKIKKNKCGHR